MQVRSLALAVALLVGCRSAPHHSVTIVVLGSSTAACAGLTDPATCWVNRYAALLERSGDHVTNLAVSGYTTFEVLATGTTNPEGRPAVDPAHNITAALALHPDGLIVNLPSNDAATGVPVEQSLANIAVVARAAHDANVAFWVTTSQPRTLDADGMKRLAEYRDRIEHDYGAHALDFYTPLAAPDGTPMPSLNQGDGIHPNPEGHRLLFEVVRKAELPAAIAR